MAYPFVKIVLKGKENEQPIAEFFYELLQQAEPWNEKNIHEFQTMLKDLVGSKPIIYKKDQEG